MLSSLTIALLYLMLSEVRYLDSGSRESGETLGRWLQRTLSDEAKEIRWQTGFFHGGALPLLEGTLRHLSEADGVIHAVVGSNSGLTTAEDLHKLAGLLGLPRANARLGVVSFRSGLFHPKTFHVLRKDSTQAAYVGSANLTSPGIALHVEAGIALDSREGDEERVLSAIAEAIDAWFHQNRPGLYVVRDRAAIDELLVEQVISSAQALQRSGRAPSGGRRSGASQRASLRPLLGLPISEVAEPPQEELLEQPEPSEYIAPSETRPGFPDYLRFDPLANAPTFGPQALSGLPLPANAEGLIIRLNRDSARHFLGGSGTANISLPVRTASTLRFGIHSGRLRPRAEFELRIRYLSSQGSIIEVPPSGSNVMAYGVLKGETGHRDLRMLLPSPPIQQLLTHLTALRLPVPALEDLALLEWPTRRAPRFRLTFLDDRSSLFRQARSLFEAASNSGDLVGTGACWLPAGFSPKW